MIARPFQAAAELLGASSESVDKFSREKLGGFVAPVPQNAADVKKDVGRGIQTAAFGLGPVSGGAAFGVGNSLEQGNDLFSTQTAFQGVLGLGAGKVLDLVGKPLLDAAGKVIGKITPQVLKDVASKGAGAISEFAATHNILPETTSKAFNAGVDKVESIANKPFNVAGDLIKKPFIKTPESIVNAREKELAAIDSNYVNMRKASGFSKDAGVASRKRIANTDVLAGSVDENGLIRTQTPGGAIDQYKAQTLDGAEQVVRKNLERLGEKVNLNTVEKQLTKSVNSSSLEGADLKTALNNIKKEISGYKLKADANGDVPLTLIHDAKINTTNGINYLTPPEIKTSRKAIASGLRKIIEDTSSFNTKEVNVEIGKYLDDISFLERLDGKRVKGGKLGKYFAQITGNIAGGIAGGAVGGIPGSAVGTVVGGEIASRLRGSALSRTLGGESGFVAPENKVLQKAIRTGNKPYLERNFQDQNITMPQKKPINISPIIPRTVKNVNPLKIKPKKNLKLEISPSKNPEKDLVKSAFTPGGKEVSIKSIKAREATDPAKVARARDLIAKAEAGKIPAREPITVDKNNKVVSGNSTLQAMKEMGRKTVSIKQLTAESLSKEASAHQPKFQAKVQSIADKMGLQVEHGPVKTATRLAEKVKTDYGGDLSKITDINRSVMFVDSLDNIGKTLFDIRKHAIDEFGSVSRIKMTLGTPSYNKVLINIPLPHGTAEIQLTTKALWDAKLKGGGEELYNIVRGEKTPKRLVKVLTERMDEIYNSVIKSPFNLAAKGANKGGFTRNLIHDIDYSGTPHIAVSPYPERTITYKGETSVKHLADFLRKNFDLLQKKGYAMGGWYDKSTKTTYLDVVIPVHKSLASEARTLHKMSNQIESFDLENFKSMVGWRRGTGKVEGTVALQERQKLVDNILYKINKK
jgi:hypothetical protein